MVGAAGGGAAVPPAGPPAAAPPPAPEGGGENAAGTGEEGQQNPDANPMVDAAKNMLGGPKPSKKTEDKKETLLDYFMKLSARSRESAKFMGALLDTVKLGASIIYQGARMAMGIPPDPSSPAAQFFMKEFARDQLTSSSPQPGGAPNNDEAAQMSPGAGPTPS